jgi:hypothetical protein
MKRIGRFSSASQFANSSFHRPLLIALLTGGLVIASGYLIATSSPPNNFIFSAIISSAVLGSFISILVLEDWTKGIYILFIWLVLEDSFRKYTGYVVVLYFIKDAILFLTYLAYFLNRLSQHKPLLNLRSPIVFAIGLLAMWGLLGSLYSGDSNWIISVIGLRMWFIYCPLVFLGVDFAQSNTRIQRLLKLWIISAGIIGLLGLLQVFFGNQFLNPTSVTYDAKLFLQKTGLSGLSITRPTSVFIDPGRYGKYTIMSLCLISGIFVDVWHKRRRWQRDTLLAGACLGLVLMMNFLSGARLAIVLTPIILLAFVVFLRLRTGTASKEKVTAHSSSFASSSFIIIVVIGALWLLISNISPIYLNGALDFYQTIGPYIGKHYELHLDNFIFSIQHFGLLGNGVGSTSLGINYFSDHISLSFEGVETGFASLVIEFGVVGLILWIGIGLGTIQTTLKAARTLRNSSLYGLSVTAALLQMLFLFALFILGVAVYQDYLISSHLWFVTGLILGVSRSSEQSAFHLNRRYRSLESSLVGEIDGRRTAQRFLASPRNDVG